VNNFTNKTKERDMTTPTITVDRIHLIETEGKTKAFCDLLILDSLIVKGLKVIQGQEGLFVSMPRGKGRDEKWHDTFFPISREMRKGLEELVLEEYNKKIIDK
jgi:stage V sporulation protein G